MTDGGRERRPAGSHAGSRAISWFDSIAHEYGSTYDEDSLGGYVLRARRAQVVALFAGLTGRVLDVGCGPGVMTHEMLQQGYQFWGVDGSARMIFEGRRRIGDSREARFAVARAEALPFADQTFDGALCIGVIDRVPEPRQAIAELARVLRPGGVLVASFANALSPYAVWRSHVFYAALGRMNRFLQRRADPETRPNLWSAAGLWTPKGARRVVESMVGPVRQTAYYNFGVLLSPLDEIFPRAALRMARRLEPLRTSHVRWLGAGFLVKAVKRPQ